MAADAAAPKRTNWAAVLIVSAAGVVAAFQIGKLPAVLHELRADLGIGLVAAGWVMSTIAAVGVATGMLWGNLADRIGHRRVVIGGMSLIALASLAGSAVDGLAPLLATRIIEGIGYIAVIAAGPLLMAPLVAAKDRNMALSIWAFYMPLGMSGMVVLSPLLLTFTSWRGLWVFNAALAMLMAVTLLLTTPPDTPKPAARWTVMVSGMWRTATSPGPIALAISFGAYSLIFLSVIPFLPTFLIERRGVAPDTAALMVALVFFMNAPGCVVGGWLLNRNVAPWILIAAGYIGMMLCALGIYAEDLSGGTRYVLALFLPFLGGFIPPTVLSRANAHAVSPALVATTIGLIVHVLSLGQLIGPPILAALVSRAGNWQDAIYLTATGTLIGLVAAIAVRRLDAKHRPSPNAGEVA